MDKYTLDASALIAYFLKEPGFRTVTNALAQGAYISTVNLSEVLTRLQRLTRPSAAGRLVDELYENPLFHSTIEIEPFLDIDAVEVARLAPLTQRQGLSLGDRACLVVAQRFKTRVLTADRAWRELDLGFDIELIR